MMSIKFALRKGPLGRVASAEIHFLDGDLEGLVLTGFQVFRNEENVTVTFPRLLHGMNRMPLVEEILGGYREWMRASGRG